MAGFSKKTQLSTEENPSPLRKLKLSPEEPIDPLACLISEVHNLLFQHFKGKEILLLFEVSKEWFNYITASPKAMRKITLVYHEKNIEDPDANEIDKFLQSRRPYFNFKTIFNYSTTAVQKRTLIDFFSNSLEDLEVTLSLKRFERLLPPKSRFLKLKSLSMSGSESVEFTKKMLRYSENLEKLAFNENNAVTELVNLVLAKSTLKELELHGRRKDFFLNFTWPNPKFDLTCFVMMNVVDESDPLAKENFYNFLLSMASTLSSLTIKSCNPKDLKVVLSQLPLLKNFRLEHFDVEGDDDSLEFEPNKSIESLRIGSHAFPLEYYLLFKNLEILRLRTINDVSFKYILENKSKLKELYFQKWSQTVATQLDLNRAQETFLRLKGEHPGVSPNLRFGLTMVNGRESLSRFN